MCEDDISMGEIGGLLADIRDMFPVPERGSELEVAWAGAMATPECVPEYVRQCLESFTKAKGDILSTNAFWSDEVRPLYAAPQPAQVPEGYKLVPAETLLKWKSMADAQAALAAKDAKIAALKAALRQKTVNELLYDTSGQLRLDVQEAWELASERAAKRDALQQDATCYHWLQRATQTQVMQVFDLAETDMHLTRIILDAIARETGK